MRNLRGIFKPFPGSYAPGTQFRQCAHTLAESYLKSVSCPEIPQDLGLQSYRLGFFSAPYRYNRPFMPLTMARYAREVTRYAPT